MHSLNPRLKSLVQRLDDLGGEMSLIAIAEILEAVNLTIEDVAEYVVPNHSVYNRSRVAQRETYEILVMTWLPGQASAPHDHKGSICALQVLQGQAVESNFTIAADGFVDLEYESPLHAGQVTAGQDAGVHSIWNPSPEQTLVTVHVYAPPLNNFRRFIARPVSAVRTPESTMPNIVIIGGGFSGAMTAAQLLRHSSNLRISLVERRGVVAEGLAYGTRESVHLLNVPAARMSAWPDRPDDFLKWAQERDSRVTPSDFLPRQLYGEYLRETLHSAAAESNSRLDVVLEEARRVARHPSGGWVVHLDRGTSLRADAVVLAIGHRPPSDPLRKVWTGPRNRFLADPWTPFAVGSIAGDEEVAILGSGLTAIDTILSLTQQPRTAPITLISRSGLMPQAHSSAPIVAADLTAFADELLKSHPVLKTSRLSRAIHSLARRRVAEGTDWRSIVDGLRPHTARLWNALSLDERQRFFNRIRQFWEVHRHRMAWSIGDRLTELKQAGIIRLCPGHVTAAVATMDNVTLQIRQRGQSQPLSRDVQWVINCTGPTPSNSAEANPVIGSLLVHDWLRRDALSLGLDTTPEGEAIAATGEVVPDLLIVGTLRKPQYWESTAVPELRQQAADVSKKLLERLATR